MLHRAVRQRWNEPQGLPVQLRARRRGGGLVEFHVLQSATDQHAPVAARYDVAVATEHDAPHQTDRPPKQQHLATHRLDVNRTIKQRFGRKSSFASPDDTRRITGQEIGGVTVFGLPAALPVWVDAAVMDRERIVLGGGSRRWKVIAPPSILLTLPGIEIVSGLANPAPPRPEA